MITYIQFLEGFIDVDIKVITDIKLEEKLELLENNKNVDFYELCENYILYFDPNEKSFIQNSVFYKHTGKVFITCKDRDFTKNDILYWINYTKKLKIKGKGTYIPEKKKYKPILYNLNKVLRIN